jgi:hypothetical protein
VASDRPSRQHRPGAVRAPGVFGTGTGRPDIMVATVMGGLGLWGGWEIVRQARGELLHTAIPVPAELIGDLP